MNEGQMAFSQVMAHGSWFVLDRCIRRYDGNRRIRSFSVRDQYLAMSLAQLTYRDSLRDIEACLGAVPDKLPERGEEPDLDRHLRLPVHGHRQETPRNRARPIRNATDPQRPSVRENPSPTTAFSAARYISKDAVIPNKLRPFDL